MQRFLRVPVLAAILLLAAFAPAAPQPSLAFPAGWKVTDRAGLLSARHPADHARCNRDIVAVPDYAALSQAELNAKLTIPWSPDGWAAFMGAAGSKVELLATDSHPLGPYVVRTGTMIIRAGATRVTREDAYAHVGFTLTPGYVVIAACYAPLRYYPAERARMEATVASLRVNAAAAR